MATCSWSVHTYKVPINALYSGQIFSHCVATCTFAKYDEQSFSQDCCNCIFN